MNKNKFAALLFIVVPVLITVLYIAKIIKRVTPEYESYEPVPAVIEIADCNYVLPPQYFLVATAKGYGIKFMHIWKFAHWVGYSTYEYSNHTDTAYFNLGEEYEALFYPDSCQAKKLCKKYIDKHPVNPSITYTPLPTQSDSILLSIKYGDSSLIFERKRNEMEIKYLRSGDESYRIRGNKYDILKVKYAKLAYKIQPK